MDNNKAYLLSKLKHFLIDNQDLLNENNFQELYEKVRKGLDQQYTPILTSILYQSSINPIPYLIEMPTDFATENYSDFLEFPKEINITKNITHIGMNAFRLNSHTKIINIERNDIKIGNNAFNHMKNVTINFNGSFDDIKKIMLSKVGYPKDISFGSIFYNASGKLICKDDTYDIEDLNRRSKFYLNQS